MNTSILAGIRSIYTPLSAGISERQKKVIEFINQNKMVTPSEVSNFIGATYRPIRDDLNYLNDHGLISLKKIKNKDYFYIR